MDLALVKAGVRLAKVLNSALANYHPTTSKLQLPTGAFGDHEAAAHVGELAMIVGTVVSVRTSRRQTTFLNFGAAYPHQTFTAVVRPPAPIGLQALDTLEGRRIGVRGTIRLHRGQAEIILEKPDQLVTLVE